MSSNNVQTKAAVTVAEMARMVGLSRARFYQLQEAGIFPLPLYDVSTRRPFYDEEAQKVCLEVRRRNCGINGKPVLFYARRGGERSPTKKRTPKPKSDGKLKAILDAVRSLGLAAATEQQIAQTIDKLFPSGVAAVDQAEVIRSVFVHLQRQNPADNVER